MSVCCQCVVRDRIELPYSAEPTTSRLMRGGGVAWESGGIRHPAPIWSRPQWFRPRAFRLAAHPADRTSTRLLARREVGAGLEGLGNLNARPPPPMPAPPFGLPGRENSRDSAENKGSSGRGPANSHARYAMDRVVGFLPLNWSFTVQAPFTSRRPRLTVHLTSAPVSWVAAARPTIFVQPLCPRGLNASI